ncbi:DMT family transporter [Kineosporia succinea]|uniref:Drug/metabolite transporter (DMT)-like permease n=1 Tax=Kineosporia succinea TaxID=84632 RepID=A0ABT9P7L1_9ACTN|nr:DMT family transporter [Kineosporia succinea]MDP9828687.1 drug/metabolite transporter (DMT)-like permease [Kineosporia succinea]
MNRRAVVLFLSLGLAWGIPYMFIKVAGAELAPSVLVLARTGLAALILLPLTLASRRHRSSLPDVLRHWKPLLAYTVVEVALPWVALNHAEQTLTSSTAAILISAVPVVGVVIALLTGSTERFGTRGALGLLLGTVGVATLVGLDVNVSDLGAVAEMGVVVAGYALGPVILSRWLGDLPGLPVVAVSITAAALVYVPVVLLGPGVPATLPSADVLVAVVVLAAICTATAFLLLFALIGELGPVRATTIVYLNPVVAVAAGALFLDERVTVFTLLGFVLVLTGSYLVNGTPRKAVVPVGARELQPAR